MRPPCLGNPTLHHSNPLTSEFPLMSLTKEKQFAFDTVEHNREAIALLCDNIFYFAELGMQEFETSKLMMELLEKAGFALERNLSGMPTGFVASYGSGKPVIALHTEFDATPACSQQAGVTEPAPIVDGAPGHTEGHNVNGAVMIGAAFAIKKAMDQFGLKGTLKVFGAPAEEQLVSRPYFVRDGYFEGVDVALHDHIGKEFGSVYGLRQYALISAEFTFKGQSAHAATAPWNAKDALDARSEEHTSELQSLAYLVCRLLLEKKKKKKNKNLININKC